MPDYNDKTGWDKWWPRALGMTGLATVEFIIIQNIHPDPYVYPILGFMLGIPVAGVFQSWIRKDNGNDTK